VERVFFLKHKFPREYVFSNGLSKRHIFAKMRVGATLAPKFKNP